MQGRDGKPLMDGAGALRRVAVIVGAFPTASETFVVDHVVGLLRHGWAPVVVCGHVEAAALEAASAQNGVCFEVEVIPPPVRSVRNALAWTPGALRALVRAPLIGTRRRGVGLLRHAAELRKAFGRLRPAVVHAHFADNGIAAALAVGPDQGVIVDFHGWDFTVFPSIVGWPSIRQAVRGATLVAHSDFAEKRIRAGTGRPVQQVRLGASLDRFGAPVRAPVWPRRTRWLVVGRLREVKGQGTAIRGLAVARAGPSALDAELTLVGDGPDRDRLERLATQLGVRDRVHFAGPLPHSAIAAEMARADILVVPSVKASDGGEEAFGRVAIEGLASGLPVVVSDSGGLPETVGPAGWTVPPGDPQSLVECVRAIMRTGSPLTLGHRAMARAAEFSIERMWREYDEVTRQAIRSALVPDRARSC